MHLLIAVSSLLSVASAWTLTLNLPATAQLPKYNPSQLPSSTQATLYARGKTQVQPLSKRNDFRFADVAAGSYLLTIQCRDWTFSPSRVDVNRTFEHADGSSPAAKVDVWQTFFGNEWGNKGEWRGGGVAADAKSDVAVDLFPIFPNEYYTERAGFSVLSFLKNPMILMGLFSLVLIVGMPMLMDSMDEETRAEFEEMQKSRGTSSSMTAASNLQNFDLAGWIAGKSTGGGGGGGAQAKQENKDK